MSIFVRMNACVRDRVRFVCVKEDFLGHFLRSVLCRLQPIDWTHIAVDPGCILPPADWLPFLLLPQQSTCCVQRVHEI